MTNHLFLIRYDDRLCLQSDEGTFALRGDCASLDSLLERVPAAGLLAALEAARGDAIDPAGMVPRAPIGTQEVWAAGVTYKRSEEARERESGHSSIYTRVYHAQRPELFPKAFGPGVVGPGEPAGIRYDAAWSVPEPELAVVLDGRHEVVGFTIGNDMSSRDIEGENPLYLPQAKIYRASCALGPRIWLQPGRATWPELEISLRIRRGGETVFAGAVSTAALHRALAELVDYLVRCRAYPRGVFLLTGTGIVPPDDFTLLAGDEVVIRADPIGELANRVVTVGGAS